MVEVSNNKEVEEEKATGAPPSEYYLFITLQLAGRDGSIKCYKSAKSKQCESSPVKGTFHFEFS